MNTYLKNGTVVAVGGSEQATRLSGVPVDAILRRVYLLSGACAALAGLEERRHPLPGAIAGLGPDPGSGLRGFGLRGRLLR